MNILIMDLLGPSIYEMFKASGKCFDTNTVCSYGIQMVKALKDVHECGIVHRDIKPKNMCVSIKSPTNGLPDLNLIDFGISKNFIDAQRLHILKSQGKPFCGTAEFTSLAAHNGEGQSRRDDLESVGLILIFFL